jgi:hypothetical protein
MWTEVRGAVECFAAKASRSLANSVVVRGGSDGDSEFVLEVYWLATSDQPPSAL